MFNRRYLEESTILHFMNLVLDVKSAFGVDDENVWIEPGYNFYLKKYIIRKLGNKFVINWVNLSNEENYLVFRNPPKRNRFLNKLYFLFNSEFMTTDRQRSYNVLTQVVFKDFCKRYEIEGAEFSGVRNVREAADKVLFLLYKNFFSGIPFDDFTRMFGLDKFVSEVSKNAVLEMLNNTKEVKDVSAEVSY